MCSCLSRPNTRVKKVYTGRAPHTHTHNKLFHYHMNLSAFWIKSGVACVHKNVRHTTVWGNKRNKTINFIVWVLKSRWVFLFFFSSCQPSLWSPFKKKIKINWQFPVTVFVWVPAVGRLNVQKWGKALSGAPPSVGSAEQEERRGTKG